MSKNVKDSWEQPDQTLEIIIENLALAAATPALKTTNEPTTQTQAQPVPQPLW